jgi:hypothetical protein
VRGEAPAAARVGAGELEGEAAGSIHEACEGRVKAVLVWGLG